MIRLRYIPNALTLANLLSGCAGIVAVAEGNIVIGSYLIWIAALFDFFDGLTARALKAFSSIGGELDSLADMVSFGVLPSFIMYRLLEMALPQDMEWLAYAGFIIAACSAIRLAIFNIDTRQTQSFIGLPTPASALLVSALPLNTQPLLDDLLHAPAFLLILTLLDAYLMVANVELMAFKFRSFSWTDNKYRYIFVLISLLLVFTLSSIAIPAIIILYVIVSVVQNSFVKKAGRG